MGTKELKVDRLAAAARVRLVSFLNPFRFLFLFIFFLSRFFSCLKARTKWQSILALLLGLKTLVCKKSWPLQTERVTGVSFGR